MGRRIITASYPRPLDQRTAEAHTPHYRYLVVTLICLCHRVHVSLNPGGRRVERGGAAGDMVYFEVEDDGGRGGTACVSRTIDGLQ